MTAERALQIIGRVWGGADVISATEVAEAEAASRPGETTLATLGRVAGIAVADVPAFHQHAAAEFRYRVAIREVQLARAKDPARTQGRLL